MMSKELWGPHASPSMDAISTDSEPLFKMVAPRDWACMYV